MPGERDGAADRGLGRTEAWWWPGTVSAKVISTTNEPASASPMCANQYIQERIAEPMDAARDLAEVGQTGATADQAGSAPDPPDSP